MKKAFAVLLAVALILVFGACGQSEDETDSSQLPNPVVEVTGSEDFEALGFTIHAPENAENVQYSIIADTIAQIDFTLSGRSYTYRAAQTDEDISGVYETFDETEQSLEADGTDWSASVRMRTIGGGDNGALATWSFGETQYSLYTADAVDADSIGSVALALANTDFPRGGSD